MPLHLPRLTVKTLRRLAQSKPPGCVIVCGSYDSGTVENVLRDTLSDHTLVFHSYDGPRYFFAQTDILSDGLTVIHWNRPHLWSAHRRVSRTFIKALRSQPRPLLYVRIFSQSDKPDELRTTNILSVDQVEGFEHWRAARSYLQIRDTALMNNLRINPETQALEPMGATPIHDPIDPQLLLADLVGLSSQIMYSEGDYDVYLATAAQMPHVLREIGRLREITFRSVGEGTGKALDLDRYDLHYHQIFIWDRVNGSIVGGYRIASGRSILTDRGLSGLYIHELFKIHKPLVPVLSEAIELGRSYIISDYQKQRLPLFLLWRGILEFIMRYPGHRYLYGPVSISTYYSDISKDLIVAYIRRHYFDKKKARYLKPRTPYRYQFKKHHLSSLLRGLGATMSDLDAFVEHIEPGHIRLPVLLKQYVKQNARFIGFNLDPHFNNALDGFMILDLKDLPEQTLELLRRSDS